MQLKHSTINVEKCPRHTSNVEWTASSCPKRTSMMYVRACLGSTTRCCFEIAQSSLTSVPSCTNFYFACPFHSRSTRCFYIYYSYHLLYTEFATYTLHYFHYFHYLLKMGYAPDAEVEGASEYDKAREREGFVAGKHIRKPMKWWFQRG